MFESSYRQESPAQRSANFDMFKHNFSHERCESPFFFKCDAHVDLIAFEL